VVYTFVYSRVYGDARAPRYGMLATVRDFAEGLLAASGERAAMAARHAAHFLAFAEGLAPALARHEPTALGALNAAAAEWEAALGHAVATGDAATALRLATALRFWWYRRGALAAGRRWCALALDLPAVPTALRAATLRAAGRLATDAGDLDAAARLLKAAMAALPPGALARIPVFQELAIVARRQGELVRARLLIARGRRAALRHRDPRGVLAATLSGAFALRAGGELEAAERAFAAGLAQARPLAAIGETIIALNHLGLLAARAGALWRARRRHEEALAVARGAGDTQGQAWALVRLGDLAARAGDPRAEALLLEALALLETAGDTLATIALTHDLALVAAARGDAPWTARLAGAARALRAPTGLVDPAHDRAAHRGALSAAHAMTDRATWVAAWHAGEATSLDTIAALLRTYIARLGTATPVAVAAGTSV